MEGNGTPWWCIFFIASLPLFFYTAKAFTEEITHDEVV
jgi:hypothetical protein